MATMRWTPFPFDPLECSGLPWIGENLPHLWRLPQRSESSLPAGVRRRFRFPAGARLRVRCNTSELRLRTVSAPDGATAGLDVYVNGRFWATAPAPAAAESEVVCFAGANREPKEIAVYLPLDRELQVVACGVDSDGECWKPKPFARKRPLVLYGSSIAQGIRASRPGLSYAAILGRSMDMDHVNLGFGGAGKAEPEVAALVAQIDACCYLLDLGKSYGHQTAEPYTAMLATLREAHPDVPTICITPIFSSREFHDDQFVDLSRHTRSVMRESVAARTAQGDGLLFLVEGEALLSAEDCNGLASDGVHPNDLGHTRIAERLRPVIEEALKAAEYRTEPSAPGDAGKPRP